MELSHLDATIRLGGIATILLLAGLLLRQRRTIGVPALLFPPMALCLAAFLIGNTPDPSLRLGGTPGAVAGFASGCAVVFLWWFCLACFDRSFRPRGGILAAGLGWIALAAADRLSGGALPALSYTLLGLGFGIVAHLVWRLYAERQGDLIQKRYRARATVALLLGGLLLIDLSVDLFLGFAWRPLWFAMAQNATILGFALWFAGQVLAVRTDVLSFDDAARAPPAAPASGADIALRQRLAALMESERIHLDPDLTFSGFVDRMNAPEKAVRRLVNHDLGFDHFRTFLNHYRVEHACTLLGDRDRAADKLIAIAYDSGFASLPSFNRVFRETRGCPPSQYRDAALAGISAPEPSFEKRSAVF